MTKLPALTLSTLIAASHAWGSHGAAKPAARRTELWYRQPATPWVEALPVGNRRLGAMVFGGIAHERIQFNESTVWNGESHNYAHPGVPKAARPSCAVLTPIPRSDRPSPLRVGMNANQRSSNFAACWISLLAISSVTV
jgi:hypothetical protein